MLSSSPFSIHGGNYLGKALGYQRPWRRRCTQTLISNIDDRLLLQK